jgi:bifunctional DNA-binding transcriptional regulator/antitoxin component of YhaV-PrlF toxin-antitoxin module
MLSFLPRTARLIFSYSENQELMMSDTISLQMGQRGIVTLPKSLRETYHLQPGDDFTLLDLGGVFILSPGRSQIDALAEKISRSLMQQGETLESMLLTLREEREQYDSNT